MSWYKKPSVVILVTLVFVLLFVQLFPKPSFKATESPVLLESQVLKVIDGDTIQVNLNGVTETVRLIGVDTPETVEPRTAVQCFGRESSDQAKTILSGKVVKLENDPTQGDKDRYGRFLRYVLLDDGTNFNKKMISEGFAFEYTYSGPYKYQTEFKKAQEEARDGKKGLWADNTCCGDNVNGCKGLLERFLN